jgi:hypothetical protein
VPSLVLAVDATTNLMIVELVWNALFNFIGSLSFVIQPMAAGSGF